MWDAWRAGPCRLRAGPKPLRARAQGGAGELRAAEERLLAQRGALEGVCLAPLLGELTGALRAALAAFSQGAPPGCLFLNPAMTAARSWSSAASVMCCDNVPLAAPVLHVEVQAAAGGVAAATAARHRLAA